MTEISSNPNEDRIVETISSPLVTGASSTRQTSSNASEPARAVSIDSRVLPAPPGPRIVTSRWAPMALVRSAMACSRPTNVVTTDRKHRGRACGAELLAAKQREVELLQLRRRIGTQLVGQHLAQPVVRRQRLVRPPVGRQRREVEPPEAVAIGVRAGEVGELGHDGDVGGVARPRLQAGFVLGQPELLQPGRRRDGEREGQDVGQRLAPPQRQGLGRPAGAAESFELRCVDVVAVQDVARRGSTRGRRQAAFAGCATPRTGVR